MTGTSREASVTETRDWQLAVFPSDEAYCGATPTEWVPFFGKAVSSMTRNPAASPTSRSARSEEHTSELQSLMRISYAVFCLKKKKKITNKYNYKQYKQNKKQQQESQTTKNIITTNAHQMTIQYIRRLVNI